MRREGWERVVCAATGPSFSEEQAALVESARVALGWKVIAINDNYRRYLPNADAMFASDRAWWRLHGERARGFRGERWTVLHKNPRAMEAVTRYGLRTVKFEHAPGLSKQPETITVGGNAGHMALHLAYLFGARTIVLVGYDMKRTGGRTHNFGDHPKGLSNNSPYQNFIAAMEVLAADLRRAGVEVINCTAETALTCFERADLARTLATP